MRWISMLAITLLLAGPAAGLATRIWGEQQTTTTAAASAWAQEGDGADGEGGGGDTGERFTWWRALVQTGVIGLIILLLSIAGLALSVQYAVEQKRDKLIPPHVVGSLEQFFEDQAYDEAAEMCEVEDCQLTRIVGAGLAQMENGTEAMFSSMETVNDEESTRVFQRLSNLALIAGVSPMLGLYGTVIGMITAFNKIAESQGAASAAQLADGISMALATTFEGLTVAIPVMAAYHFLKGRALNVTAETNSIVASLFERFRSQGS